MTTRTLFDDAPAPNPARIYLVEGQDLPASLKEEFSVKQLEALGFTGAAYTTLLFPSRRILLVGTKTPELVNTTDPFARLDSFRLGGAVARALLTLKLPTWELTAWPATWSREGEAEVSGYLRDVVLGWLQAGLETTAYKEVPEEKTPLRLGLSAGGRAQLLPRDRAKIHAYHAGLTLARQWIDATPEEFHPGNVVERVASVRSRTGSRASLEVLDQTRLEELGAGGILAVGRASAHPPVLTKLTLDPSGPVERTVCLVGKGVTYDSGGLDIKTGGHMHTMKCDMGGAATMGGVCRALEELGEQGLTRTRVVWFTGWVENMISGSAYKSDDILTTLSGQTVEVWNTDAEGRLTLADALSLASLEDPDYIVDAATLTGACVLAVSEHYTALMGNSRDLNAQLERGFLAAGEKVVNLPLPEVLREQVQGELGDLRNTGKERFAGHLTAGLFLSHFVEQAKFRPAVRERLGITSPRAAAWAHLDVAGSSFNAKKNPLELNGATGASVRALCEWLLAVDAQTEKQNP